MIAIFTGVAFVLNIPSFFEFRPTLNKENKWELTELRYLKRPAFRDAVFITHCIGQYEQQSLRLTYTRQFCRSIFENFQTNPSKIMQRLPDFQKSVTCSQILARF